MPFSLMTLLFVCTFFLLWNMCLIFAMTRNQYTVLPPTGDLPLQKEVGYLQHYEEMAFHVVALPRHLLEDMYVSEIAQAKQHEEASERTKEQLQMSEDMPHSHLQGANFYRQDLYTADLLALHPNHVQLPPKAHKDESKALFVFVIPNALSLLWYRLWGSMGVAAKRPSQRIQLLHYLQNVTSYIETQHPFIPQLCDTHLCHFYLLLSHEWTYTHLHDLRAKGDLRTKYYYRAIALMHPSISPW
ncbi:hypothetical protein RFI_18350, partial [Reticulomyxa filosa]